MARLRRFTIYALVGLGTGLLVGLIIVYMLTTSRRGMNWVRRQGVQWIDTQIVGGTLTVDSISGAGLLGGLTLHGFKIVDLKNRPFVNADSATLQYNWRTVLRGN